jgi:hypothetical protein
VGASEALPEVLASSEDQLPKRLDYQLDHKEKMVADTVVSAQVAVQVATDLYYLAYHETEMVASVVHDHSSVAATDSVKLDRQPRPLSQRQEMALAHQ